MAAKLLLAEDSRIIQKVFELTLKQTGISITVVDNGVDAIRLAEEISPDLVVADVSLPGKDGFEVAKELRSREAGGFFPVLILAGSLSPLDEDRFRSCGADGVLFKPFESQELIAKVEDLLRSREETAPAPVEEERPTPAEEEPWDFSDVLSEMEGEAQTSVSREAFADDLSGVESAPAAESASSLSLEDFDVSLEEIERVSEGEAHPPETALPIPEETAEPVPPEEMKEDLLRTEQHLEEFPFDDSPPAITDLTPAFETVEEVGDVDFLETIGARGEEAAGQEPREEAAVSPPPEPPGTYAADAMPENVPTPPSGEPLPGEKEFRELFSERAQEIFERVAAEAVEKVMWEMMEGLAKEFTEKIRESVEAVAWEVVPSTTEALIREEIARIREQSGKETS
jgi:DNA-binding response OmpR family regulator